MKTREEARQIAQEYKENRGKDEMSASAFILLLTILIAGGIAVAAAVASVSYNLTPQMWWLLPYFACALIGCILAVSQHTALAAIGYLMVILPTGWIVGPYVKLFQMDSVIIAAWITVSVTIALGIIGAMWHKSVAHWGGYLLTALLILIAVELGSIFLAWSTGNFTAFRETLAVTDWIAIAIFSGFVFYDMNQAVRMPRNVANAIMAATNMYLNMINLFIRILARSGKLAADHGGDAAAAMLDA